MRYSETVASKCRYGEVAERIFREAEILWEHSEEDYSGSANVFAKMPDGQFCHYEWVYGSCCRCDDWEHRGLSDDAIEAEMRKSASWLKDLDTARRYLRLEGEFAQPSIAGDFLAMRDAFNAWCKDLGVPSG